MQRRYDKDPYAILGISPTATASQVKQAYHKLARQYHPDLNKDPRAIERMKDINWANSILSDPQERALYDAWRSSGIRMEYQRTSSPPPNPSPNYTSPPYTPPRRTTYKTGNMAQGRRLQGWSTAIWFWLILTMLMNVSRMLRSASQPAYVYPVGNAATQTAYMEEIAFIMKTLRPPQNGTATPSTSYQTLLTPSPATAVLTDEFGHPDMRARVVPGSWEWGQINHYFPDLTTPDGLSDEVLLVTYDQLRGYRILTRSQGEYWLFVNVYDNSIQPAHFTPTPIILRDKYGHEDIRPQIVPGSQEWEWINTYFPALTTPDGLSDEVTFVFWDQNRRGIVIETAQSGLYIISIYGGTVTAWHEGFISSATATIIMSSTP